MAMSSSAICESGIECILRAETEMFKLGICTLDELLRVNPDRLAEERRRFKKYIYVGLYDEVASLERPGVRDLQESILELFATANGAYKRTSAARFDSFDQRAVEIIGGQDHLRRRCVVHDIAVSDARTSCDFYQRLDGLLGDSLKFFATDYCVRVYSLGLADIRTSVVVDEERNLLQIICPPFVLPIPKKESWLYPVNRFLRALLLRWPVRVILARDSAGDPALLRRETVLICNAAKEIMSRRANFSVEAYDIFKTPTRGYSVVRAMNIFNKSYFSEDALRLAIAIALDSIEDGGLFITGSNQGAGSAVNGGIYQKKHGRVVVLGNSGNGSPINDLIKIYRTKNGI
jgi:hypothetical protein